MNNDIEKKKKKKKSSTDYQHIPEKITEILSQYENGIESILEFSKKDDEENYLMLLFNCPDSFHQKFSNLNKSNSNSFNHSTIFKFYGEIDKKKTKNEINNELEISHLNSFSFKDSIIINIEDEKNE